MKKIVFSVVLALMLVLFATPVYAVPMLPHAFCGSVTINDLEAPDGTLVSAAVANGSVLTNSQNPVATAGGSYELLVQGDGLIGDITFYVNGDEAESTPAGSEFEVGGGPTEVDLAIYIEPEPEPIPTGGGGGGGGGAPRYDLCKTNFCGDRGRFDIDKKGMVIETVTALCKAGPLSIEISKGTIALGKDGKPLSGLSMTEVTTLLPPPEGANIIGLPFDLEPDGATFDPPMTLTWTYDPADLPDGVAPEDLVLAYFDEETQSWVELECKVDTEAMTVTATVSHFTEFALLSPKPAAPPVPTPPAPEPTKPTPAPEPPKVVPIPAAPVAPVVPPPVPTPPAPPTPAQPWAFTWLAIAAGLVVLIIIVVAIRVRHK